MEQAVFVGTSEDFVKEFKQLARKYDYKDYHLVLREEYDGQYYQYTFDHSRLDEHFIDYMTEKLDEMKEKLDENNND